jgi:hypothetical protein
MQLAWRWYQAGIIMYLSVLLAFACHVVLLELTSFNLKVCVYISFLVSTYSYLPLLKFVPSDRFLATPCVWKSDELPCICV